LPITHAEMTRYVMSISEAADLVLEAGSRIQAGEVYVTKMRALRIVDLAHATAELLGKKCDLVTMGARPGEKLYEELISLDEMPRTLELERLLVVLPPPEGTTDDSPTPSRFPNAGRVTKEWHSSKDTLMTKDEIGRYLKEHRVIDAILEAT
jgi:FlaA1/EpsC-like NDP-sugar epimerase